MTFYLLALQGLPIVGFEFFFFFLKFWLILIFDSSLVKKSKKSIWCSFASFRCKDMIDGGMESAVKWKSERK